MITSFAPPRARECQLLGFIGRRIPLLNLQRHLIRSAMLRPFSAPIAPAIAEYISLPVPAITRAVNVDALNSCSAYKISDTCIACTHSALCGLPCSRCQKVARNRVIVVRRIHINPLPTPSQSDTSTAASTPAKPSTGPQSPKRTRRRMLQVLGSGSSVASTLTPTRSTSIGCADASAPAPAPPSRPPATRASRFSRFL